MNPSLNCSSEMIKKLFLVLTLLIVALLLQLQSATDGFALSVGKITFRTVDELGEPVEGVSVGAGFYVGGREREKAVYGFTDGDGKFTASAEVNFRLGANFKKQDYYDSYLDYTFKRPINGKFQPWNPTVEVLMRKIENPVPMYARRINVDIPEIEKEIGFDLFEADWVTPYGKGKRSDFIFKLEGFFNSLDEHEQTLIISFPNKFDGIQLIKENLEYGSEFKLPRFAPESGYQKKVTKSIKSVPGKPYERDYKKDNNYIFRVRSEEKDGKLERAMYGKIQSDISFGKRTIIFTCYLNPDYTRNLEFDPKRNLFKNLPDRERVGLK